MVKLKRKYFLVELIFGENEQGVVTTTELFHAICEQVAVIHGDYGVGSIQRFFQVKVHDARTNVAVLRITSNHGCEVLVSSLPFVLRIGSAACTLRTVFEGSSIRTIEKYLIKINLETLYARLRSTEVLSEKTEIQNAIISVTGSRMSTVRI